MPDFGQPVAQNVNVNPSQGLNTLSSLIGVQQQKQALQTGAYQQQTAQAQAIQQQQTAKEVQTGAQLMSDPVGNGITDSEGKPTKNAYTIIKQAMPTTGDARYNDLMTAASGAVNYKKAWLDLDTDARNTVSAQLAGPMAAKDADTGTALKAISDIRATYKGTPSEDAINQMTDVAAQGVGTVDKAHGVPGVKQYVMGLSRGGIGNAGISGPQGLATPQAATQQPGASILSGTTAPPLEGGKFTATGSTPVTVPPGFTMGPNQQLVRVGDNATTATPLASPPGTGAAQPSAGQLPAIPRPGPNSPGYEQQQYQAQNKANMEHVQQVAAAYSDPQNNPQATRYRNREILRLTDTAATGPGKDVWNHVASQFPGETGDAYQKIGHYLAQNTIANIHTMGVNNTDAGDATAAAATGNVGQNPGAIKEITKVNDAVNTARDQYTRGLQKITQNQSNFDQVPAYRQAFGQNFDVNLFRLEDAQRRGDQAEVNTIAQKLGPQGLKALGQKKRTIDSLVNNGSLPQQQPQ